VAATAPGPRHGACDERYPLVSILIPNYNYVRYVEQAVASAVAQTYPNVEVVVSDNCSTDGAWELLVERFGTEPRVRLYRNESNLGMGPNFDRVLELARGDYVTWLSSDDLLYPNHVAQLMTRFVDRPDLDVVYGNAYFAGDDGVVYDVRSMPGQFPVDYVDVRDELVENFTTVCPVCLPCMLVKREALAGRRLASDPGSSVIASDWEIVIKLAIDGKRFAYVAEPTVAIRVHDGQRSGESYHGPGQNVIDFAVFVERYLDHPEFVNRMRGHELAVAKLLGFLVNDNASRNGGTSRLDEQRQAWIRDLQQRLLTRALAYEPARVRDSTISVVVETATLPPLLFRSLDSLLAQTRPAWELVLVDHGKVDLEAALRQHPIWSRTSYVRLPTTQMPGVARNLALRMVRGEYVAFLDPGNRYDPGHLAAAVETIAREGAPAALAGTRLTLESVSRAGILHAELGALPLGGADEDVKRLDVVPAVPLDAIVVYRGTLERSRLFNETLPVYDDWDFLLRLARIARIASTGATTLNLGARLGLIGHRIGDRLASVQRAVDAIYAGYPVDAARAAEREGYRADLLAAVAGAGEATKTTRGLAEFSCALVGRHLGVAAAG
jgi:glycosyltransferase involved in cell wall biosynthesis